MENSPGLTQDTKSFEKLVAYATPIHANIQPLAVEVFSFSLLFRFTSESIFLPYCARFSLCTCSCTVGRKEVSFSMTIGNEELTHECFPKHLRMGTAKKYVK